MWMWYVHLKTFVFNKIPGSHSLFKFGCKWCHLSTMLFSYIDGITWHNFSCVWNLSWLFLHSQSDETAHTLTIGSSKVYTVLWNKLNNRQGTNEYHTKGCRRPQQHRTCSGTLRLFGHTIVNSSPGGSMSMWWPTYSGCCISVVLD